MPVPVPNYEAIWKIVPDKSLEEITERAQNAFWEIVAGSFADKVKTGDFPPDVHFTFETECKRAIAWWLQFNHPELQG